MIVILSLLIAWYIIFCDQEPDFVHKVGLVHEELRLLRIVRPVEPVVPEIIEEANKREEHLRSDEE